MTGAGRWITGLLLAAVVACGSDGGASGPGRVLVVTPDVVTLGDCGSLQLVVELQDGSGTPVPGAVFDFGSTANSIAAVNGSGRISGEGPGSATIVIGSAGLVANVPVTVSSTPLHLTGLPDTVALWPGVADTLAVGVANCHGTAVPGSPASLGTDNGGVASVTGRTVTGVAYGVATLTVTSDSVSEQRPAMVIGHPRGYTDVIVPLPSRPYGVAVTAAGRVLVTQIGSNTLATGQLPGTALLSGSITVGNTPPHVSVNPAGTRAFVTNQTDNSVSVVDLVGNQTIQTVPLAGNGFNLLVSRNGTKVFVTTDVGWAYVLDATNGVKSDSFMVGLTANGLAEHPSQPLIYFSSRDNGTVTVYNFQTAAVVDTLVTGGSPQRLAVSPDGNELYIANEALGVDIWSIPGRQRITTLPLSAYGLGLSPDGARLFVAGADANIHVIDVATRALLRSLAVGVQTRNVAFEASGRTAIVTDQGDGVHFIR